jgi:hypothetical protein
LFGARGEAEIGLGSDWRFGAGVRDAIAFIEECLVIFAD